LLDLFHLLFWASYYFTVFNAKKELPKDFFAQFCGKGSAIKSDIINREEVKKSL
jgi:hypothetical protein